MRNYYDETIGQRPVRPELQGVVEADVCIVGAGFAGMATALGLLERGTKNVVVLDAERVGFGASGRNGGFVFGGYSLDCADLLDHLGEARARHIYGLTRQAVDLIRKRIVRHAIECEAEEGGALLANWFDDESILRRQQGLMHDRFGVDWQFIDQDTLRGQWVRSVRYTAGLVEPDAFHFHPLKYALGEAAAIESLGGRIFERSRVTAMDVRSASTTVKAPQGEVVAKHVVIAGGGYLSKLIPKLERAILPIATYVMTTEPLGAEAERLIPCRAAIYDTRFAFDYYRRLNDSRILWGGRISIRDRSPDDIAAFLKQDMLKVFPSLKDAKVDHAWGGMMSYARHKMPQIGRLPNGIWYGLGFGGHGVAPTTAAGELIARAIAENEPIPEDFKRYGLPPTYRPFGLLAAQATYSWFELKDAWRDR
ncbi:NAD(P)/FAD-dependent oxidoreductase [Piscinibacter terrae]|uniref:FAD-binding oxidoreductase n=1 Tax=Piscinibacter terrae TaxID=2496871 RepID=A0A3N7HWV9_9BURK|nr:FAD-binding oxidoreductase [Albitalea terrae]